jgi:iron complex outermembrane receptor protein
VSSSLLGSEDLEAFRVVQPQDIVRITPNASATDSGSRSFGDVYQTRGLANTVFFGAPATTVYVDDVPFGETFTNAQRLAALNSVEVFRGPQPTLVGRSTYAGLVNIRSQRPGDRLEARGSYRYGSFDSQNTDLWIMGPVAGEALGFRIAGTYDVRDGYLTNPESGTRVDHQEHWGLQGGLFWKPARGWDISVTASYDEYWDGAPRLTSLDRTTGFYTVTSDVDGRQNRTAGNQAIRAAYENKAFRFLSVTSHRGFDLDPFTVDLDFTSAPIGFTTLSQSQELWSQEFRVAGNRPDAAWQWNTGLYGSVSRIKGDAIRGLSFPQSRTDYTVTRFVQPIPTPFGTLNVPLTARSTSYSDTQVKIDQRTVHRIDEESAAWFGGVAYEGWKPITLHAGGRLDWVRRSMVRDKGTTGVADTNTRTLTTIEPVPGFPAFPAPPVDVRRTLTPVRERAATHSFEDEWVHFTPTGGVDWQIAEEVMAFVRTSWAFKPGGFSAYADDARLVAFGDETAWSTEAGIKSRWFDGRLTANVSAFLNAVRGYQVERSLSATDYAVLNAAQARTYGMELDAAWDILPELSLIGSIGWTHARLTDYTDPVTGRRLDGVTPPFVPEFDATVALDFHLPAGFFTRVDLAVTGKTRFDDLNRPDFQQDTFGALGASVGWRGKNWNVGFYGSNLTDTEFYTLMNPEVRTGAPGLPREFGVRVGLVF